MFLDAYNDIGLEKDAMTWKVMPLIGFRKRKNNDIFVNNLNFNVNRSDQQFKKKIN